MSAPAASLASILECAIDRINIGVFIINSRREIVLWNHFMEVHSGCPASTVIGRNLFECFPDLPRNVVENKIKSVLILKNFAFSGWEQRPYLFKFRHNRPVTGGVEYMYQDCTFMPIKDERGAVEHICVTVVDTTDVALYKKMHKEALDSLAEASHRDGLTGIYNRRFLEEAIAKEFNRARRYGGTLSVAMLDLDHFKLINDTHGHLAGDEVLRTISKHLENMGRSMDTLGRYGGEEFAVLLPETTLDGALTSAERVITSIENTVISHGETSIRITVSVGIAQYHSDMTRYEELIQEADDALYEAKNAGRNCVRCALQPRPVRAPSSSDR
ncbi:MAG: diguanylate cyclase [Gammaproteobacteria bacterium]|jgi:diguanylate cyclase (GGDEF)-like protein